MKKALLTTLILGTAALTVGCSSAPTYQEIQKERYEAHLEKVKQQQEEHERLISKMPEWVIEPPRADETGFYGVGHGLDEDPIISARKSMIQAKF